MPFNRTKEGQQWIRKRKLDGGADKFSMQLLMFYENSGGLHLGLMAGRLAGRLVDEIQQRFKIFKACRLQIKIFDFLRCLRVAYRYSINCFIKFNAFLMLFQPNTATRLFYRV